MSIEAELAKIIDDLTTIADRMLAYRVDEMDGLNNESDLQRIIVRLKEVTWPAGQKR